jgi:hypothetical protein
MQVSALLHLLVATARRITENVEIEKRKETIREKTKKHVWRDCRESFSLELQRQLVKLLSRFRDDSQSLSLMCDLLSHADLVLSQSEPEHGQSLVQSLVQLQLTHHNEALTQAVARALHRWLTLSVEGAQNLSSEIVRRVWSLCRTKRTSIELILSKGIAKGGGSRSSIDHLMVRSLVDSVKSLREHVRKFQILWEHVDGRSFVLEQEV